jgi:hypothetical protein
LLTTGRNADAPTNFSPAFKISYSKNNTLGRCLWTCRGISFHFLQFGCALGNLFAKHQQYEPKYLYYHFVLSFMSCYYHFMLSFILCYTFLSSFDFIIIIGVIVYFLFEPINKDLWYFYLNIVTKLSKIWVAFLEIRIWDLRSGIRKIGVYDKTPAAFF